MPSPARGKTTLTDKVRRVLVNELRNGWSRSRVAADMQALGHPGWNEHIVNAFATGVRQSLGLDEGLALLAVFGARARMVEQEIEKLTGQMVATAEKLGSPAREGLE